MPVGVKRRGKRREKPEPDDTGDEIVATAKEMLFTACETLAEYGVGTIVATYEPDGITRQCIIGVQHRGMNSIELAGMLEIVANFDGEDFTEED